MAKAVEDVIKSFKKQIGMKSTNVMFPTGAIEAVALINTGAGTDIEANLINSEAEYDVEKSAAIDALDTEPYYYVEADDPAVTEAVDAINDAEVNIATETSAEVNDTAAVENDSSSGNDADTDYDARASTVAEVPLEQTETNVN